jgi:low affinity Fe/Cu permease
MTMPSEIEEGLSWFDRFANVADRFSSHAWYFALCVLVVALWAASYPLWRSGDTWQLVINTSTTILTFWMVALQRNADRRDNNAAQQKLNALALALICVAEHLQCPQDDIKELKAAIGVELRESTS